MLTKSDYQLEEVRFVFNDAGEVVDILIQANYAILNDSEVETRVRKSVSIWESLTPTQQTQANTIGKRLNALAQNV